MTLEHVYSRVRALVDERDALEMKLQAAQEYIEHLKSQRFTALLAGIFLGAIMGAFWKGIVTWTIKFFQQQ